MKLPLLFFCLLLQSSVPSFAQNQQADSLRNRLALQKDAGKRAELHLQIAEAFVLAEKYDSATVHFERALTGFEQTKNKAQEALCLGRLAINIKLRNQHERAMQLDFKALSIWDSLSDQRGVMRSYCNLGLDFYYKGDYKTGVEYSEKAIAGCQKIGDEALLAESYRNAASNHLFFAPDSTKGTHTKPGVTGQRTKALAYLDKALEIAKRLPMAPVEIARIENWRGNVLKYLLRNEDALAAYVEARRWFQQAGSRRGNNITAANIAHIYINTERYDQALPIMMEVVAANEKSGDSLNLVEQYQLVGQIYENLNDYKNGLEYFRKGMGLQWKLFTREREVTMAEIQTKYETAKKEAQIAAQQAEIARKSTFQWLLAGAAGLLALFLFQTWRTAKFRRKTNEKLAETNTLLEKKNAENVLLLKEIHHRVKNNLQTISSLLSLQSAHLKDDSEVREAVEAGQHRVQSMALIHQKLYQRDNLAAIEMCDYLTNLGKSLFEAYQVDESRVSLKIEVPPTELDVDTAIPVGLIVNELLTNSLKYAFPDGRTGIVNIALEPLGDRQMMLRVADNGVGVSKEKGGTAFGARLVQLLTLQLEGQLEQSSEGGYRTQLTFPTA